MCCHGSHRTPATLERVTPMVRKTSHSCQVPTFTVWQVTDTTCTKISQTRYVRLFRSRDARLLQDAPPAERDWREFLLNRLYDAHASQEETSPISVGRVPIWFPPNASLLGESHSHGSVNFEFLPRANILHVGKCQILTKYTETRYVRLTLPFARLAPPPNRRILPSENGKNSSGFALMYRRVKKRTTRFSVERVRVCLVPAPKSHFRGSVASSNIRRDTHVK